MHTFTNRRDFLKTSIKTTLALGGLGLLMPGRGAAVEPFKRRGTSRLELSLAAYSFRDYFNHKDSAKRITLFDFIDFCADQGCQGTELTSYYFPTPIEPDYLVKIKRHAFLRGIEISGGAIGNNFALPNGEKRDHEIALAKKWVDYSAVLGAPHIRVFAGTKGSLEESEARKMCISALEECADYAGSKGIFLGLENHGGIVAEADGVLEIIKAVKSPWLGVNLDTGNFQTDDPYADLARCAPYAVNVQVKVEIHRHGQPKSEPADLARVIKILRDANYQGYLALEYESAPDPWKAVPEWLKQLKDLLRA